MGEITFIGTSSGVADAKRFHSSLFLNEDNYGLLIDAGDGVSKGLLNAGIGFDEIDGVIITHTHADHLSGIAALITQMKIGGREKGFEIFIYKNYKQPLSEFMNLSLLFPETFSFELRIVGFEFDKEINAGGIFTIIARRNSHVLDRRGIGGDFPFASASLFLKAENARLVYTSDVGGAEDLALFDDLEYDIFISECEHISPEEIIEFAVNKTGVRFFVTHYTGENEINNAFNNTGITVAKDKLKIGLN